MMFALPLDSRPALLPSLINDSQSAKGDRKCCQSRDHDRGKIAPIIDRFNEKRTDQEF